MLKLTIFLSCVYLCWARPGSDVAQVSPVVVPILSQENEVDVEGKFSYSFEAGNGIKIHEEGSQAQIDKDTVAERVSGSYEYPGEDGKLIAIRFTADENGYHAEGDSIPVAPPIPEPIQKALRYLEEHPEPKQLGEKVN